MWLQRSWVALVASVAVIHAMVMPSRPSLGPRRDGPTTYDQEFRLSAIRETFHRSWSGYRRYAWGHDSLRPISNTFYDDRNGWGASAVDALSTAIIMGERDVVKDICQYVQTINWSRTNAEVSLFETTIRYLGGLISGYDLLKGPYQHLSPGKHLVDGLLIQAQSLADILKVAFDTPSGIPDNELIFDPEPHIKGSPDNFLATAGTLVLEWERLSDLTGNEEYGRLAKRAQEFLIRPWPQSSEPFPGMVGSRLWVENGTFADATGSWSGGTDSFYEYLIKMYIYDPERFEPYKKRWMAAVDSSMTYLASHPGSRPDLTFLSAYAESTPWFYSGHLACFDGGNFILGGLTLGIKSYVEFGLNLTDSCHETYIQTSTGIGPEIFQWQDGSLPLNAFNNPGPPDDQREFYERSGFWIISGSYVLRPEVIESFYYAYRATGDKKYRDWAWEAFMTINRTCSIGSGLSSIVDVNPVNGTIEYYDFQESFWFAEVMKYSWLIQLDDEGTEVHVQGDGRNRWVFNTEAHPVRVYDGKRGRRRD